MPLNSFSVRVENDARFFSVPPPPPSAMRLIAVRNQLLVKWSDRHDIINAATTITGGGATELTTLYTGLSKKTSAAVQDQYDVAVYELDAPGNIFELVDELRTIDPSYKDKVSVNSVLIPALSVDHHCPFGPPSEDLKPGTFQTEGKDASKINVTLIDVGYQWDKSWDPNPLPPSAVYVPAEQLPTVAGGPWQPAPEDTPAYTVPGTNYLAALDGHANFTAGVILQHCPGINVTMRCNSSTFDANLTSDVPTEMTVARALCDSYDASVIDLAYAFRAQDDIPSPVWRGAIEYLKQVCDVSPVVVCPAGNQSDPTWRFPAALWKVDPQTFGNVVGVGSIDRPAQMAAGQQVEVSQFSNWGGWVKCYANGSGVRSTFIRTIAPVEEDPLPRNPRNFSDGWATWNGSCFAAAKVAAAIACTIAHPPQGQTLTPVSAWQQVEKSMTVQTLNVPAENITIKAPCLMGAWS